MPARSDESRSHQHQDLKGKHILLPAAEGNARKPVPHQLTEYHAQQGGQDRRQVLPASGEVSACQADAQLGHIAGVHIGKDPAPGGIGIGIEIAAEQCEHHHEGCTL